MENTLKKVLIIVLLVLVAVVSFFPIARWAESPQTHSATIASIDGKIDTVLKLTASSTIASAGISAIPDDTATPIAEKLADFSEDFLFILCVLYSEKYLLTIIGAATFKILIPCACAILIIALFWKPELMQSLAVKLAIFGLALFIIVPLSIKVSDLIYKAYDESIAATISSAENISDDTSALTEAAGNTGLISSIWSKISDTADTLTNKAANVLSKFVETLAVMIVTSCIIPILVLLFFLWLLKTLTGIDYIGAFPRKRRTRKTV